MENNNLQKYFGEDSQNNDIFDQFKGKPKLAIILKRYLK